MTHGQIHLYWRSWAAVKRRHGWTGPDLLSTRKDCWCSPELHPVYDQVWQAALARNQAEGRALIDDDLRHGVHVVALGAPKSSTKFTNADFDSVLSLLRLLDDPDDLRNVLDFGNREAGERRRLAHTISQAPEKYWQAIARDKFGTINTNALSLEQFRQLALTVRARWKTRCAKAAPAAPAPVAVAAVNQHEGDDPY